MRREGMAHDTRAIIHRTRGLTRAGVTRLVSPGDLGDVLKPFVFLDLIDFEVGASFVDSGFHPHSGIATVTYLTEGDTAYEDTTGRWGTLPAGGVEWMFSGRGIWHKGAPLKETARVRGFQLWIALAALDEGASPKSIYLTPDQVPSEGPVSVLLGRYGTAESLIGGRGPLSYLSVRLKAGERWRFAPPVDQTVGWVAVSTGSVESGLDSPISAGELAIFEPSAVAIDFTAQSNSTFVLGSAVQHPHELVRGHYSVHTSDAALAMGEAEIRRIGVGLRQEGRIGRSD